MGLDSSVGVEPCWSFGRPTDSEHLRRRPSVTMAPANIQQTMYTIKQAAARSGVAAPLIRAWERRYRVVKPARTPAGYRLYDDEAIRVLLAMRGLVETGWTASEAARAIGAGEVDVAALATSASERAASLGGGAIGSEHRADLVTRFVRAAEADSSPDTERILDEMQASGSYESVVDDLLLPAAAALGEAWAEGRLSVAGEHAASAAVARRLAAAFQAAGRPGVSSVVVGLPPGSRHELGALAFATALRRRGVGVLYLGPDVPVEGWLDAVDRTQARAAVIGVVMDADRRAAAQVVEALLEVRMSLVAIGGAAASDAASGFDGAERLPPRVVDAAATVAEALGRRRR
jgi:DNA-binding transcriptional MerR regulator/methylmalonyl-CoA mutase cobalamin-binding subunit